MTKDLIFEIGTEELPAKYIPAAIEQFKERASDKFKSVALTYESIRVYATPRRLILFVKDLIDKQDNYTINIKGPTKKSAFDGQGNPTKALVGFLNGQKARLEDIKIRELNGSEYIYIDKEISGRYTIDLLKEILPDIIKSLNFPKSMRWGNHDIRFARPIRWLLAIYGNEVIKFDIEGVSSSNFTYGHRFLSNGKLVIESADEFFSKLEEAYVIYDQDKRKKIILDGSVKLAESVSGKLIYDDELLEEITYIVEYPTPLIGSFDDEFLRLPNEVVMTPMKEHQRYFPVMNGNGRLLPYFITVRNGDENYIDEVKKGNERVLRARLKDADFFYEEDLKHPLEYYVGRLKNVLFQAELGTLYDKTQRIIEICESICEQLSMEEDYRWVVNRAAYLSKADLVTQMVYEFDELQGIMGMYYAMASGEKEEVAKAIKDQYKPSFSGDELPETMAGRILSIADKMDTVVGCFSRGLEPTGSQDPYGLRRSVIAIINIILNGGPDIDILQTLDRAATLMVENEEDKGAVENKVINFIKQRFKGILIDEGIRYDVADAVLDGEIRHFPDVKKRAVSLMRWLDNEEIELILTVFKRVSNLARYAKSDEIRPELLIEDSEKMMYDSFIRIKNDVEAEIKRTDYDHALDIIKNLYHPLNKFFENVLVMTEDEKLKENRLALLLSIQKTMSQIANFSLISY
ncbi:glycine--tRNA ligase subunit beta [Calorimonas adulescens]|uniref:Glycine--tRNA ligase beta subunit n=1 Tax=Calorimonas adulescens TaxID=2606906 RepID=A0A5D8QB90_9THEO|nr:glycine--tRNA ligase subunit beta [Calorimonas adulescens]TZE81860.1 glycine--tRNA ligase subunit beta [Calorimonas adulescens]